MTLEDLEIAMGKRKLPKKYAREFMQRARSHLFSKSFGWKQFLSLMEQREPTILRAYTSLCLSKSGTLQKSEILTSLKHAGLPANEDNAVAMMRYLAPAKEGSISYGHFRNFMLLLPSDRLQDDPRYVGEVGFGSLVSMTIKTVFLCLSLCVVHIESIIENRNIILKFAIENSIILNVVS